MKEFFATYPVFAWSIVSTMLALVVVVSLWEKIKWWALNTWMSFPVIGKIARLSKNLSRDNNDNAWFKSEKALCQEYKKFIRIQSEYDFNEKITYLTKAGDNGRKDTPFWIWILTIAMVFVEAMGFSYVLAGYTLPGASENLQQTGAYGIAFLISVVLVALTHMAGHELFRSTQIVNARKEWQEDNRKSKFSTGTIALANPQSIDDGAPAYTQLANRVGTRAGFKIGILTAIFVIFVAVFATYVRGQVLEKTLHQEVVGSSVKAVSSGADGLDMSTAADDIIPASDQALNDAADKKAKMDETSIDRHGGWATFIVLAFVFVFLQILGVIFGFKWGFAGQNSHAAFKDIGGGRYATYADVREEYQAIADMAQSKLENLQQKLLERNSEHGNEGIHTSKTFYDYMKMSREIESRDRESERIHTEMKTVQATTATFNAKPSVAAEIDTALDQQDLMQTLKHINSLKSKEEKKNYILSLDQPFQSEVMKAIKENKLADVEAQAKQQLNAELEDLL